ncbi:hypothetical protein BCON_0024g00010 [Botryotinia convoluta]|uniref:Uncharacterized protein n=1 Tax=Botryotinia convoluta TaxID=54673 RepID=A0A4Z1IJM7_9HELO|nr:hypothetical protein BCON_0024g00010 [Botryotinia convoluta]
MATKAQFEQTTLSGISADDTQDKISKFYEWKYNICRVLMKSYYFIDNVREFQATFFLPPHYNTTYNGSPSAYHESAPNTYDYYYPKSVSQGQWLYGRGSGQPSYSPLMPYHEQTQWQQSESPQRYVNSYSGYGYSNPLQQQEQALREQIAYEQANFQQFPTSHYIISSDRQNMRNRFPSTRLTNKPAPFRFINSISPVRNVFKPEYHMIIDVGEPAEPSKPVSITRMGELDFDKMLRSIEHGKFTKALRVWDWDDEKDKSSTSMVTNRGTSSDSEEVSGAKLTEFSKIFSKAKRQARSEAWFDPGSSWNPFSKTTRRNKSYAKEQLREAESTINESILITCETGHVKTAKSTIPTQRQFKISKTNNYSNSNKLDSKKIIHNPELRHVKSNPDLSFRPNIDGEKGQRKNHEADVFWVVVPTVCSKKWCEKLSSKQPFDFWNLHSGI